MTVKMTSTELRATTALASIMAMRMLGLFMILPVFALYAHDLPDVTPFLIGLAIGVYGLSQAILQIPFGMLSDRFGRKPIITIGLLIFIVGSIVAALSTSIVGIIIGRALQGAGAIAAAILALLADLTREEHRTKAMAMIGSSIAMSFIIAFALGTLLNYWVGVPGIFWFTALLALGGLFILHFIVPSPIHSHFHRDTEPVPKQFKRILVDTQLLRLNFGIATLHFLLTALFIELPMALKAQLPVAQHWQVYLPVMIVAVLMIIPFIIFAEKRHHLKLIFVGAIGLLCLSQISFLYAHQNLTSIVFALFLFFTAFNLLEASLPSLVSKIVRPESKGTAMGVYSTSQFMGAFLGGAGGGWLHHYYSTDIVFIFGAVLAGIWLILAATMQQPRYLSSHLLNIGMVNEQEAKHLTQQIMKVVGVIEAVVIAEDGVAYLKVDKESVDLTALEQFSVPSAI